MRPALLVLLFGVSLFGQQAAPQKTCSQYDIPAWRNYGQYDYQRSVLALVHPKDRSMITLSVFVTANLPKVFLRMKAPGTFELLRALPSESAGAFVARLEASCQLPLSPREAAPLMDLRWEHKPISQSQFMAFYNDFTKALSTYVRNVADRPAKGGDRIMLHSQEFSVSFETSGFENFEITAVGGGDAEGNPDDLMAKWAASFVGKATALLEDRK
jgi:hypothetical protein